MPGLHLHRKHFRDYFASAAIFADDAENQFKLRPTGFDQQRLAQASILYSALCIEAAANCCLDYLAFQEDSEEAFEKLNTLAKFDLFLMRLNPSVELDREHPLVRPIRNLIKCRNEYVHSKVVVDELAAAYGKPKIWQPLGLPHNSNFWQSAHAVKVFTVVSDFLNHFFFNLCGITTVGVIGRGFVRDILCSALTPEKRRSGGRARPIIGNQ